MSGQLSDHDGGGAARGFSAFPARKGGRARGQSWWGGAWAGAMEDAWPDEEVLKKARAFARSGRIGPVTVSPGRIAAQVYGGEDTPCTTVLTLRELGEDNWDLLWDRTAERPAELAALLAGELPPDLLEAAEDAGLGLLPGYGDLEPDCDCDEPDHPCAHALALGYQVSWLLDKDPFLLLLVRGRNEAQALEDLKSTLLLRAMTDDDEEGDADAEGAEEDARSVAAPDVAGTPAAQAYAREAVPLPPLPALPEPLLRPDEPATGLDADPLEQLIADAAARARELLAYTLGFTAELPPPLDEWQDTVRIAATHPDPRVPQRLRESCGRPEELDRAAAAWRTGGAAGLDVLERRWDPPKREAARARTVFAAAWEEDEAPEVVVDGNRWTLTGQGIQLRQGRDDRWYPYRDESGIWWPAGEPSAEPALALAELLDG
ncbi:MULTISPECIES: hypothetical protein [unclassified Streptomyces]|uniref:SWIM zinc finger family protein n=1 Tax=unclassified Streptomyces TaxID=2593676 RepID=UPI002DDAC581|nr:hypothetical protein [Streptomyces sp. NBC_01750]WSA98222.1 hypothetical protein OIE54_02520 [Streptomyces sp. NBC_01794]WSD37241.1 hypothetical protein OG966_38255 [Streptomyces sp. NBC_01750]